MPQASVSMSGSSSLSQNQDLPHIHACRWAWCRLAFFSNTELVQHVIHDHVHNAVPVKRKDIPMLRRAEEGLGESLSLSGFGMSHPSREDEASGSKIRPEETSLEVELPSSLPSPPASSPTSLSHAISFEEDEGHSPPHAASPDHMFVRNSSPKNFHAFDRQSLSRSRITPKNLTRSISPMTPPPEQARDPGTPTFASLSSPLNSPSAETPDVPPTPSFNSMVDNAIGVKRRRNNDSEAERHRVSWFGFSESSHSQSSQTSSGSHDLVEKQLTQSMDMSMDSPPRGHSAEVAASPPPRERNLPAPISISAAQNMPVDAGGCPSPPVATPVRTRQPWYGTLPPKRPRNAASSMVGAGQSVPRKRSSLYASQSIPSQPSNEDIHATSSEGHVFRSGTLKFTPVAAPSGDDHGGVADPYSQDPYPSWTQSQSETQESSLDYLSYPPLQTQAPYQSQSLSQ
ncbi:hypothetical protein Hypma_010019 [Hypsizygus marmoreus]|uniref:C2H2-type domain-containing protein n=1 Tax=Hypsizygus marmoreus TaxID=39966 RepID=A0A369JT53_HYPMA|nr:hypothetical protein Hypma_010019 [Hypsizygus marmoreus]